MLQLADLKKEDDIYTLPSIKVLGKECKTPVAIEVEDEIDIKGELEGLSKYIDWLNSKDCLAKLSGMLDEEGIDCEEWYADTDIVYVLLTISEKGEYSASISTEDDLTIDFEGKEIMLDLDEMCME